MKVLKKRVGDIYLNPLALDLWILKKIWLDEENKEVWVLELVHDDYYEQLKYIDKFIKLGNIYDLVKDNMEEK